MSRQVSNLNSSDPESDVLPITPRDNFEPANIEKIRKFHITMEFHLKKWMRQPNLIRNMDLQFNGLVAQRLNGEKLNDATD